MNGDSITVGGVEAEYTDIANRNAWALVYQKIGRECHAYPYTCTEAKKLENKPLNRYRDVNPYDHSRVILKRCERDYINANLVKMDRANRKYILTQGPLAFTVGHFWLMVWEQHSRAILMLNKIIEKNETKCHWYWPRAIGEESKLVLNDVQLTIEQISEEDFNYYSTREFRIVDLETGDSREVIQFHYTTWPDFGVPQSPHAFLEFLRKVRASGALDADAGPAVVHCSAGIGRSGTFCLVDSCLVIIEKEGIESVSVQQVLLEMRKDRMGLIQTPDQLRFSYQAIIEGAKRLDPDYKESKMEESIYSSVPDEPEEPPPPPPPRGESLSRAPGRPLPSIPNSASLVRKTSLRSGGFLYRSVNPVSMGSYGFRPGDIGYDQLNELTGDVFQQCIQEPPPDDSPSASPAPEFSSADDEDEEPVPESGEPAAAELRRRRTRDLAERVSAIKRRARDAERWHDLKRSLYKPLTITFGVILAGIVIYAYVKH